MAIVTTKIIPRALYDFILTATVCLALSFQAPNCLAEDLQASAAQALKLNCEQMLEDTLNTTMEKNRIIVMQQQLIFLDFNPEWVDGILGPRTESALRQFCQTARFALNRELQTMLQNHVLIAKEYPHWMQTLEDVDFEKWADEQPDADEIPKLKMSGNPASVIALLDRYRKQKKSALMVRNVEEPQVSYMLTTEDFSQLKAVAKISKLIAKLQGKTYADKQEFESALEMVLKDVPEQEKYINLVLNNVEPQPGLKLSDESFNHLRVALVPAYILQSLQELKNVNFPPEKIVGAVKNALDTLSEKINQLDPSKIVELAKVSEYGSRKLTAASLKEFSEAHKDDPAGAATLLKLQKLRNVEYQSAKTMTAAMENVLKQVSDQINGMQKTVFSSAEKTVTYGLSDASMQKIGATINESTLPETYLEILDGLQDVEYPSPQLFWQATVARITMAELNNTERTALFATLEKEAAKQVDEVLLEKLRSKKLPPALIVLVGNLQGRTFSSVKELESEVANKLPLSAEEYEENEQYHSLLVSMARKMHPLDKKKTIQWDGQSCNCVHDNLSGDVYGFYPYWLAGERQKIDFSVQTRFGFYALGFDDQGSILDSSTWSEQDDGFIREARTYGSKVDLVLHKSDWSNWEHLSSAERGVSFEKLAAGIEKLLNIPLSDITSTLVPYASLGIKPRSVMGDGITLYFEGYPRDAESVDAFMIFIRNLALRFQANNQHQSINIMFNSSEIGTGIYDYPKLIDIMAMLAEHKLNGLYAVLLREPTTNDKKFLRSNIEVGLHGEERKRLLRNVTTVITYNGQNQRQLKDDVIYARDNFGGMGFWPQPVMAASSVAGVEISNTLHENFMDGNKDDVPGVCKYICPHKWAYRIAFCTFLFAMLTAVFMRFINCSWRVLFDDHFIYFIAGSVAPTFLLGLALLFCDPGLDEFAKGNGLLIFVILGIVGYSLWNYQNNKDSADLP